MVTVEGSARAPPEQLTEAKLGAARFERLVRTEMTRRGKVRPCLRIVRKVYTALADRAGVLDHRAGAWSGLSGC